MADNKEKKVGEKRKFSFSDKTFSIREILDAPKVKLQWVWSTGICPHCNYRINRDVEHDFYRIEILADDKVLDDKDVTLEDIQILGDTLDKRRMILPADKYNEILLTSKIFKKLTT